MRDGIGLKAVAFTRAQFEGTAGIGADVERVLVIVLEGPNFKSQAKLAQVILAIGGMRRSETGSASRSGGELYHQRNNHQQKNDTYITEHYSGGAKAQTAKPFRITSSSFPRDMSEDDGWQPGDDVETEQHRAEPEHEAQDGHPFSRTAGSGTRQERRSTCPGWRCAW